MLSLHETNCWQIFLSSRLSKIPIGIGVRSGCTSGGTHGERRRWVRAEWGGVWGGVSPLQPTKGSGERRELPQRGPGQSPGRKRILAYFEGYRTLIFVPIWQNLGGGGQFALASPRSKFWGDLSSLSPPWSPMPIGLWLFLVHCFFTSMHCVALQSTDDRQTDGQWHYSKVTFAKNRYDVVTPPCVDCFWSYSEAKWHAQDDESVKIETGSTIPIW